MSNLYRSPHEAYPFLSEAADSYACDFEVLTDEVASLIGALRAEVEDAALKEELLRVCTLVYHANPTLRTHFSLVEDEVAWLAARCEVLAAEGTPETCFVLPVGSGLACTAHIIRVRCKALVRLVYRHLHSGGTAPNALIDFCSLLSGYFYLLALHLNREAGIPEETFQSRNYK